jgi:hypothetical protein
MQQVLANLDKDIKESLLLYVRCLGKDQEYYYNNLRKFRKEEKDDEINIFFGDKQIIHIKFDNESYKLHRCWLKGVK